MAKPPATTAAELQLAQLTARVDQALATVEHAMRTNLANRPLVDVCLDVRNTLHVALDAGARR